MANPYVIGASAPLFTSAPPSVLPENVNYEEKYKNLLFEHEMLEIRQKETYKLLKKYISKLEQAHKQIKTGDEAIDDTLTEMTVLLTTGLF